MKAFRNIAGNVVEIDIDLDLNGNPILPPDTTTQPRPAAQEGHYVTVVGNSWVQIPVPQAAAESLESKRQKVLDRFQKYRNWLLEQPVEHDGIMFDGDDTARARMTQAIVTASAGGQIPPAWVTYDNGSYALADENALKALVTTVMGAFGTRFFQANAIRDQILAATDIETLEAIEIPSTGNGMNGVFGMPGAQF